MSYRDKSLPTAHRVNDLLKSMTLTEKLAQMGSVWVFELTTKSGFDEAKARTRARHGLGQITRLGGASLLKPQDVAKLGNRIQRFFIQETRLGIPVLIHEEACSGYLTNGATIFPQALGLAATFNDKIVQRMGEIIREEMRALGGRQALAPLLDVTRDPRWGRTEETFGEDPYLVSRMGSAFIRGLQGSSLSEGVIATGKHFVGYGQSEGGMNWAPAHLPARELRDTYLTPFEVAVKEAGLQSIMPAYSELDGVPCHTNQYLLQRVLRDEWGFTGTLVSDYFGIAMVGDHHRVTGSKDESAAASIQAGLDVELPSTDCLGTSFESLVKGDHSLQNLVDAAVTRILTQKFELGLFEEPFVDEERAATRLRRPDHLQVATEAAAQSLVLLKNDGVLPLASQVRSVAVVGPNADNIRNMLGDYTFPAHVESLIDLAQDNFANTPLPDNLSQTVVELPPMDSVLTGLRGEKRLSVTYAQGCEVVGGPLDWDGVEAAARAADVIIAVVGDKAGLIENCTTGEARDRAHLGLPGQQEELVRRLVALGKPVVLVLIAGRPLALEWEDAHVSAILHAWMPGEGGARAIADVLTGRAAPGGRTPITVPRTVGQVPIFYAHKPSGGRSHWKGDYVDSRVSPLYPFGHGLTYTAFDYTNFSVPSALAVEGTMSLTVDVANVGPRDGDEVVQLYVRRFAPGVTVPVQELLGFCRVTLAKGERRRVAFRVAAEQLGYFDTELRYWVAPGPVTLWVGGSSADLRQTAVINLTGTARESQRRQFETVTSVEALS